MENLLKEMKEGLKEQSCHNCGGDDIEVRAIFNGKSNLCYLCNNCNEFWGIKEVK